MRRDLARRLARAEVAANTTKWADRQAAHHRESMRNCVSWHQVIRERLRAIGIDPALAVALQRGEEAVAELAAIPDTDELRGARVRVSRVFRDLRIGALDDPPARADDPADAVPEAPSGPSVNKPGDDQVDSTVQFLDWFKKPMPHWGIFELTRMQAEAAEQRRKPPPVQTQWVKGSMEWLAAQNKSS